jgi:hypothetical protein
MAHAARGPWCGLWSVEHGDRAHRLVELRDHAPLLVPPCALGQPDDLCQGTWARVTTDRFRCLSLKTFERHLPTLTRVPAGSRRFAGGSEAGRPSESSTWYLGVGGGAHTKERCPGAMDLPHTAPIFMSKGASQCSRGSARPHTGRLPRCSRSR